MRSPSWSSRIGALSTCALLALLLWGVLNLLLPAPQGVAMPPAETAPTPRSLAGDKLPQAWAPPAPRHTWTPTPTSTSVPPTPTATPTVTPWPTASPSPTATLRPTPRPTPIHAPADSDPTRIQAPSIRLDTAVITVGIKEQYEKGVLTKIWEVADYAAGFHESMARPGHVGNTVISGHNNARGEVFRDIDKLKPGDEVYVWVGPSIYRYKVEAIYQLPMTDVSDAILAENHRWIESTDDQRLTLVTCWPYWGVTHRTVVVAFPTPWE
jgi:sortase A